MKRSAGRSGVDGSSSSAPHAQSKITCKNANGFMVNAMYIHIDIDIDIDVDIDIDIDIDIDMHIYIRM